MVMGKRDTPALRRRICLPVRDMAAPPWRIGFTVKSRAATRWRAWAMGLAGLVLSNTGVAAVGHLQVEYRDAPLGIDVRAPRFSWQNTADARVRGFEQIAYQIVVKDE